MDNSTSWTEEYRGEAADVFGQKIKVLIKYQVLNQLEENMLRGIAESMRSMTIPTKASNIGVVDDRDSQGCWETLYRAILPFKSIKQHWILDIWDLINPNTVFSIRRACHCFNIDPNGNVYKMYHDYQMQNDQIRPTLKRPWGSKGVVKREDGKWVDREWSRLFDTDDDTGLQMMGRVGRSFSRLASWAEGCSYADVEKALLAPLPEDYETAKALLDEPEPEYHLISSGAVCSLGKAGFHNVVLVGKAEDMTNVCVFVKDTVDDLLEAFPSVRAGFLIGVDATAPEESLAKPGDIVVAFPQGFQPGQVQFDVKETIVSNHISTTFEMSDPPSSVKSVINDMQSPKGRQDWGQYLQHQSSRAELASIEDHQPLERNIDKANKVLRGKVASSARLLSDRGLANRVGCDSKIMCFERAGASIKSRFPILTICGILGSTSSCSPKLNESALRQIKMATVIYTMFVSHRISTAQLEDEHAFTDRFQYEPFDLESAGFRLVLLEKGVQSQLRCQLWQAYLNDIIPYESLSYSWGSQSTPHEIIVDEKILSITESLHEALWHLRKPDEDRMLWVDALCIDQTNIKERGHQVNRMGEIYKKADKVVVWLGYLSGNATKLKSAITMLEAQVAELPGIHRKWPREDPRWKSQWKQVEASLVPSCHTGLVDGLQSFMEKPWFSRVWILQEVANAKRAVVTCNLGDIPGWIFALLPSAMDVEVSKQCQAVLDIMPHSTTSPTSRNQNRNLCGLLYKFRGCQATDPRDRVYALLGMATDMQESGIRTDYAKEEQMVMQELYAYIVGEQWPAVNSPASSIQELQRKLPDISRDRLQQKLESTRRTDLLEQCLLRQGLVTKIGHQHLFYVMQHGSAFTNLFLDKSESPFQVSSDVGLQCLQRFPDVFEILLQRSDFVISHMPNFVAQAIEYRPQILERLIASSSNPEKLRVEAILHAIQRGLPTCRAFLDNCESPVKISQEMVKKAMFCHRDVLQYLLEEAQYPIDIFENLSLEATLQGFHIIDEYRNPIVITKELISEGIVAGSDLLQLYLVTMEPPIELEEDLFIKAIDNGLGTLECMLRSCTKPFNITKRVYGQGVKAGIETLSYLFPESATRFEITESSTAYAVEALSEVGWCRSLPRFEKLVRGIARQPNAQRAPADYGKEKLQITDKIISLAGATKTGEMLKQEAEQDVPEDTAIRAIEDGPEAFTTLLNKRGTNFRVTQRIREVASGYMYAFEVLRVKRQSEVFPDSDLGSSDPEWSSFDLFELEMGL
ncbi:related to heterokaryon incompatibility protein [Fusarium oxysporum]|uniref:Related to heterokaryon incompatibility protein n=1 Tax=Fusarium oxysporum TaxID=5507 RepID=A0A2H3SVN2_FUSOX|nr:related to heterokaryon incompatibility protein [Fusarium oxysporum]